MLLFGFKSVLNQQKFHFGGVHGLIAPSCSRGLSTRGTKPKRGVGGGGGLAFFDAQFLVAHKPVKWRSTNKSEVGKTVSPNSRPQSHPAEMVLRIFLEGVLIKGFKSNLSGGYGVLGVPLCPGMLLSKPSKTQGEMAGVQKERLNRMEDQPRLGMGDYCSFNIN